MRRAHLLPAAVLLFSMSAFAQEQSSPAPNNVRDQEAVNSVLMKRAATMTEPWRITPQYSETITSPDFERSLRDSRPWTDADGQMLLFPSPRNLILQSQGDVTCYTIRSYVVARDSKDSDSTHPAGYSTCQPSNRFQLKSTVVRTPVR